MGTFDPLRFRDTEYFKTQVIVSGVDDPDKMISGLEDQLNRQPSEMAQRCFRESGLRRMSPECVGDISETEYMNFLKNNFRRLNGGTYA